MKIIIRLVFATLVLFTSTEVSSQRNCSIEIDADQSLIEGDLILPGDEICLLGGNKDYLLLRNIHGTQQQPITIINKQGAVVINTDHVYGIKFDNCSHIIFTGTGDNQINYGIQVKRVGGGAGMSVDNKSTNIEIEFVEVSFTEIGGIYAKTEPYQGDCDNLITRENFTMFDLKIHDCYIHDIGDEGFYVGSSKYTGQTVYQCESVVVLPHVIEGVEIYNNIVENTGWDGIQVSSAASNCKIYNNIIRNDSFEEELYQMSGILIGGGSQCDCYNNQIYDGYGDGIDVFGMGNMKIFNNLIVRPGEKHDPFNQDKPKSGIYVGSVPGAFTTNATFKLYNNTIISPKSFGISYNNAEASMGYIINNLITDPGFSSASYINLISGSEKITKNNNFLSPTNLNPHFLNYNQDNYDLKPDSPAINYGVSLTNEGITFDILDRFRPFHTYFDAGAYECHDPLADIEENSEIIGYPYPVPAVGIVSIPILESIDNPVRIQITTIDGKIVLSQSINGNFKNKDIINLDISGLSNGKYILSIITKKQKSSKPLIVIK
jgi:parallel beta helix pectate lyase-like protein/type IX secretion system substrate protein